MCLSTLSFLPEVWHPRALHLGSVPISWLEYGSETFPPWFNPSPRPPAFFWKYRAQNNFVLIMLFLHFGHVCWLIKCGPADRHPALSFLSVCTCARTLPSESLSPISPSDVSILQPMITVGALQISLDGASARVDFNVTNNGTAAGNLTANATCECCVSQPAPLPRAQTSERLRCRSEGIC